MSFGLRDQDWIEPPEPETFRAAHRDCANCTPCPCDRHGWCSEVGEFVELDEIITVKDECCSFEPSAGFDPDWEKWEAADAAYDRMRDEQMEEEA